MLQFEWTDNVGSFLRSQSNIKQHCICKVTPKLHCSLKDLDFTILHTMFRHSVTLSTSVENWLTVIQNIRNKLAHVHSTSNFDTGRLEKWWTKLEGSVIGLAGEIPLEYYLDAIQGQISLLKNADFDIVEKNEILDLIKQVKSAANQLAEIVDEAKRDIVCKQRTESVLLQDKLLDVYVSSCADTKLQIRSLGELQRSQIEDIKHFQEETSEHLKKAMLDAVDKGIERFIKRIGNLIFLITCDKIKELHKDDNHVCTEPDQHRKSEVASSINIPETKETQSEATCGGAVIDTEHNECCIPVTENKNVCKVEWKIVTPGSWDVERISRSLNKVAALLEEVFQIEFVMLGSLIIKTSVPLKIIQNTESFAEAVESFLRNIWRESKIDTSEYHVIPVYLTFNASDKTSISTSIQTEQSECENCVKLKTENNILTELVDDWYKTITELSGGVTSKQHVNNCSVCNVPSKSIVQCCFRCNKPMCSDCSLRHKNEALHVTNTFMLGDLRISDIKSLRGGRFVLADDCFNFLVSCNMTDQREILQLPGQPWCIAVLDDTSVAVTLPWEKQILIIQVLRDLTLTVLYEISACERYFGIDLIQENMLVVSCESDELIILDSLGEIQYSVKIDFIPYYFCTDRKHRVFYTDNVNNSVVCIDTSENIMFTIVHPFMKGPDGITTDDCGYLYVICTQSHNILKIKPDDQHVEILCTLGLHDFDVSCVPHICYDPVVKSILVGMKNTVDFICKQ
ncbi:unnamed protein product [Mytilus edulis]|uniref:B box-type domain-containing protein n=1 Tax=Mytilus edulis TaxID=6550 RepID=A0A8S3TKV8_MYTED|nr:unnamed protein product [Mytilus edulis]